MGLIGNMRQGKKIFVKDSVGFCGILFAFADYGTIVRYFGPRIIWIERNFFYSYWLPNV